MWVQADALIAFCNDSTMELVSVPAFTAPKGVLRTAPRELELVSSRWAWGAKAGLGGTGTGTGSTEAGTWVFVLFQGDRHLEALPISSLLDTLARQALLLTCQAREGA